MKKTMAVMAMLLLPAVTAWAGSVSETDAMKKAQQFLDKRGRGAVIQKKMAARGPRRMAQTDVQSDYYVFNVGTGDGFVIVSGDDRTTDILGYADSGTFDQEHMPDGLRYLLDGYAEQMAWLDAHQAEVSAAPAAISPARSPIAPLIETRWNQGAPYNNLCPEIDDEKTVTGCVATSMAQLMYYHQWPKSNCTDIPAYTTSTKNKSKEKVTLSVDGLTATSFAWGDMTAKYTSDATGTAADEVAKLMQYCGVALQMSYGLSANDGSSAYSEAIPYALKDRFGYDGGVRHAYRRCYSYTEWVDLIYSELANNRPVALGGQSMGGGHSFVCDGYDTDDYFHINWGWGGGSDGYFRLSLLNPYEQGIGGSSTLDGFSFGQNAVIGIQPPVSGNKDYCLSLEGLRLSSSTSTSQTFTRNVERNFTGIALYFKVYNYHYGSNSFDYAVQLVDANGNAVHTLSEKTQKMSWDDSNTNKNLTALSIPSTVSDGTYYIKVMSRPTGTAAWQECFDGDRYQLTAVISGDQLTVSVPIPATVLPTSASFAVSGDLTQGHEQEVTASVTAGALDYSDNLFLGVKEQGSANFKAAMGKMVDIPAGQTVDIHFTFIPSAAGETTLALFNGRDSSTGNASGTKIGNVEKVITVSASDATNTQELTVVPTVNNLSGGKLYGNALHVTARVTNPSTEYSYAGKLSCSLREYDRKDADIDKYVSTYVTKSITVAKGSYSDIPFEFSGLELGKFYRLRFSYQQGYEENGKQKIRTVAYAPFPSENPYEMGEGYAVYAADGTVSISAPSANIEAGNAACVDLTGINLSTSTVTPGSNPNCIYLLPDGASVPASLSGSNVVCGTTASNLALTDGHDFFTPIAFTATDATYTRTFTVEAEGTRGWNTLFLPFTATTVTCPGLGSVDWFKSATDEDGNFWLRNFTGDGKGSVVFDYAASTSIAANTPYIIAVPGSYFGSWQMTDKAIVFSGTNVDIAASMTAVGTPSSPSVSGNHYKFSGSTVSTTISDVYLLNAEGSKFVKAASETVVPPFRAWFTPVSISSLSRASLSIASPEATAIRLTPSSEGTEDDCYFTLDGRRLPAAPTAPGVYVKNRKKVIIK
ncbi:MAG: C10 family peptidase [Prevotella sp.]|nr:C10 family peptidase [Prevotella sp.]